MRAFNEFERAIIYKSIELDKPRQLNTLANLIEADMPYQCYISIGSAVDVTIQLQSEFMEQCDIGWIMDLEYEMNNKLLTIVTLFNYLADERLAFFVGGVEVNRIGKYYPEKDYNTCDFYGADVKKLIFEYANKRIFISETLKVLANNNFKSEETIRAENEFDTQKKNLKLTQDNLKVTQDNLSATQKYVKVTQIGLLFTFLGLIASIAIPVWHKSTVEITNKDISLSLKGTQRVTVDDMADLYRLLRDKLNGKQK
jgi:hypothetical protein